MKKYILLLFSLISITSVLFSQKRESVIVPKFDLISDTLHKSEIKYYWKSQVGIWEEKNVIYTHFICKSFIYEKKRYYMLFTYYQRTGYKYPSIHEGAYTRDAMLYLVYTEEDYQNCLKEIKKKKGRDFQIKTICSGELFSDLEGGVSTKHGTYEFTPEYAIRRFLIDKNESTIKHYITINSQEIDNISIVRFRDEIVDSVGLDQQHYECLFDNFIKLFTFKELTTSEKF
jgi:hypothetical protein